MCVYTWLVHTHLYFHFHHLRRPSCTSNEHTFSKNLLFLYLKFIYLSIFWRLITLQYCIDFAIHWHGSTCVSHPEHPTHIPPHPIPLGHPSAPAPSTLSHASNLDWRSVSHMIIYMFQCYSLKSSHPCLFSQSPKDCSLHLGLFCCLAYRVIVTIFLNSTYMH